MRTRKAAMAKFDLSAALTAMLDKMPGVVITKKMNSTNFTAKNKVFAFTKGRETVVLKLPPDTVERVLTSKKGTLLVMGKKTMKEWVAVPCYSEGDCRSLLSFFKDGMIYVSSPKRKVISRK
jgi:hypothetical protein